MVFVSGFLLFFNIVIYDSSVDLHIGWFCFFTVVKSSEISTDVQVSAT